MNQFNLKIKLLLDITIKKRDILTKILNVTENQNCILSSNNADESTLEMFRFLSNEKQSAIDAVLSLDTVFQRTFDGINHYLNDNLDDQQRKLIKQLQILIDEVTILDEKIRNSERDNNKVAEKKEKEISKINVPKMDKNKLMEHYRKNSSLDRVKKNIKGGK